MLVLLTEQPQGQPCEQGEILVFCAWERLQLRLSPPFIGDGVSVDVSQQTPGAQSTQVPSSVFVEVALG